MVFYDKYFLYTTSFQMANNVFLTKINVKYYIINENNQILVIRKSPHMKQRPCHRDLPGWWIKRSDFINYNENIIYHAGLREVEEECGIILDTHNWILIHQYSSFDNNSDNNYEFKLRLYYYIKLISTPLVTLSEEHTEYKRCSQEEYLKLNFWWAEKRYHDWLNYIPR